MKTRARKNTDLSMLVPAYFATRIKPEDPDDPLARQVVPSRQESRVPGFADFCGEKKFMTTEFLIHRYPDRAVLLATNRCFGHCRFCFRRDAWFEPVKIIHGQALSHAQKYLRCHPGIKELIISGGDPLTLSNRELARVLRSFDILPQLSLIRVASRALSFCPKRIDHGLVKIFQASRKPVWFVSHFNHARELGRETILAVRRLKAAGVNILNQTVLLRGVNDRAEILSDLFRRLAGLGVKPYYLFQCDPCVGTAHFSTDLISSLGLMEKLGKNSGIIVPRFAFELPGFGKLSPGPGWKIKREAKGFRIISPAGKNYFYPTVPVPASAGKTRSGHKKGLLHGRSRREGFGK